MGLNNLYNDIITLIRQKFYNKDNIDTKIANVDDYLTTNTLGTIVTPVDTISDNNTRPATSNAVYDVLSTHNADTTVHTTKLDTSDIIDNLTTDNSTKALSAKQGKAINDEITYLINFFNGESND